MKLFGEAECRLDGEAIEGKYGASDMKNDELQFYSDEEDHHDVVVDGAQYVSQTNGDWVRPRHNPAI